MRAAYITAFSKTLENLRVETVPDPIVTSGEAKIKILAASVNPSDVKNIQGKMEGTILPRIPGRDFAGVVVDGPSNLLGAEVWGTGGDVGFTRDGTHAEFIVVPVDAVTLKPRRLSFEQAACVGVNFVTAYLGLVTRAKLQPGETLLVTGAGGGVGSAVLQLGQSLKARLIAADRKPFEAGAFEPETIGATRGYHIRWNKASELRSAEFLPPSVESLRGRFACAYGYRIL